RAVAVRYCGPLPLVAATAAAVPPLTTAITTPTVTARERGRDRRMSAARPGAAGSRAEASAEPGATVRTRLADGDRRRFDGGGAVRCPDRCDAQADLDGAGPGGDGFGVGGRGRGGNSVHCRGGCRGRCG